MGVNALLLGFASRLYLTARGITNEDAMLRFYRRHLGLEQFVGIGLLSMAAGLALDALLAGGKPAGEQLHAIGCSIKWK